MDNSIFLALSAVLVLGFCLMKFKFGPILEEKDPFERVDDIHREVNETS